MSTQLTLRYFWHFQELLEDAQTRTWHSWWNRAQKKVLESAGLVGDDLAALESTIQTIDQVRASLGHCATLEAATAADLRRGVWEEKTPQEKV